MRSVCGACVERRPICVHAECEKCGTYVARIRRMRNVCGLCADCVRIVCGLCADCVRSVCGACVERRPICVHAECEKCGRAMCARTHKFF